MTDNDEKNVHGEGNHEADRLYREQTKEFIESGRLESAANEAKEAVEGSERSKLEAAERKSQKPNA